jgi:catechol 2,3-dioxygenase-like lactoylglutathione lyase family enzyme
MKRLTLMIAACCLCSQLAAQTQTITSGIKTNKMKLNAGIVTSKLATTKAFYTQLLGFGVRFENDFYLLLHTPDGSSEISFLLPEHPSQQPLFQKPFQNQGVYLTIEVDDVDQLYRELKAKGAVISIDIRNEPWGDRHFALQDPNGIGIDFVHYAAPASGNDAER